ncbi:MAG: helix-turn-helix domain-containing protein [Chloroflexota bacterium]
MIAKSHYPTGFLSQYVSSIWLLEAEAANHKRERTLPTGAIDLVFNLAREDSQLYKGSNFDEVQTILGPVVCGAHTHPFGVDTTQSIKTLGIHFKPGGAAAFLGLPADELQNQNIALQDLWGPRADALLDQLRHEKTIEQRFALLDQTLRAGLDVSMHTDRLTRLAIPLMEQAHSAIRIKTLADQFGLSQRQFYQIFRQNVGVTPKVFLRLQRFQKALKKLDAVSQNPDWAIFAAESDYYDQAHLIREFSAFTGLTPTQYQAQKIHRSNHVPLPA